ncbi:SMEK domain-containing protein [Aeoliella sp. ICT_H6.2]|uniref:SMEK domain-containing protein n=1 Tax=Aeoliella straminimaris TaxID=2954799 RepID=A0A9X2F7L7_9BACT|nr:SMEK domain-containing protein [Aeoliella straminimaris]MCO6043329.1 SMEK domain-containing protein [Aeoliella straminimaris]
MEVSNLKQVIPNHQGARMLAIQELRKEIRFGLAVLQGYIRPGGSLNLTDINVHAEYFVGDLLNEVRGWRLKNTNVSKSNYPCIDLIDNHNRIGIQVTSEKGAPKINQTIKCLDTHGLSAHIDHFKLFSLLPKQGTYKITETCAGVAFNWRVDVLDFDTLLQEIYGVANLGKIQSIRSVVTSAMPRLFASRRKVLLGLRSHLARDLSIFDRQVMDAPFQHEDPLLMYKAIRQMRVTLQKNGSSRLSNEVAAQNFDAAKNILTKMEYQVRNQFPDIHYAAMKDQTSMTDKDGDFGNAITLMMQIRQSLKPLLDEVQQELDRIDAQLLS